MHSNKRTRYGKPAEQIILAAVEIEADLIIVGHRDQGTLARWLNGSVGELILHQPPCSVLVAVKSGALREQRYADETAGGAEEQIRLVVFQPVAAFAGRRSVVSNQFLPAIMVPASDRRRLEELARGAAEQGDADALSLLAEINRAKIVPDRAERLELIVTMGSWVTYWADWGGPRETRQLVYPEKYTSDGTRIPGIVPTGRGVDRAEGWKPDALLRRRTHAHR